MQRLVRRLVETPRVARKGRGPKVIGVVVIFIALVQETYQVPRGDDLGVEAARGGAAKADIGPADRLGCFLGNTIGGDVEPPCQVPGGHLNKLFSYEGRRRYRRSWRGCSQGNA